jgi:hypothetical protein
MRDKSVASVQSVATELVSPLRVPGDLGAAPADLPAALSMAPGPPLATGKSRAWTFSTLLIVPFATLGAAIAAGGGGLPLAAIVGAGALVALLGFNAFLLATDGTFIVEARRLVFRMRVGLEQAWPFDPRLRKDIRWTGNRVFFTRAKTLHLERNADELAELLQQLCDPALHDAARSDDTAFGKAVLIEKGRRREGAVVLRPQGATFVDESDGCYLFAALVGAKPLGWRLSAVAVAELAPHVPAQPLDAALGALAAKGLAAQWSAFQFAQPAEADGRRLELRREGDRMEVTLDGRNPAAATALGRLWRETFARLDG